MTTSGIAFNLLRATLPGTNAGVAAGMATGGAATFLTLFAGMIPKQQIRIKTKDICLILNETKADNNFINNVEKKVTSVPTNK